MATQIKINIFISLTFSLFFYFRNIQSACEQYRKNQFCDNIFIPRSPCNQAYKFCPRQITFIRYFSLCRYSLELNFDQLFIFSDRPTTTKIDDRKPETEEKLRSALIFLWFIQSEWVVCLSVSSVAHAQQINKQNNVACVLFSLCRTRPDPTRRPDPTTTDGIVPCICERGYEWIHTEYRIRSTRVPNPEDRIPNTENRVTDFLLCTIFIMSDPTRPDPTDGIVPCNIPRISERG